MAIALRVLAVILWVAGLIFLLGVVFPVFPSDALVAIAFFLAAYTVPSLA